MPKVYNKRTDTIPKDAVYVGRPSKWGNPFVIGQYGGRHEVVGLYYQWLVCDPESPVLDITELRGKDLVCWCAPEVCHADILLEIANA